MDYISHMINVETTQTFNKWLEALKDDRAAAKIKFRLLQCELGNFGDQKSVGSGISEMRINYGPGYRIYFTRRGQTLVIILAGGTKQRQDRDIAEAIKLAKSL